MPDNDYPRLDPLIHPFVFSASQIETAQLCLRKWAFDKIDECPREDTEPTLLGSAVHGELEMYLKHARAINTKTLAGKIAITSIKHQPLPMSPGMRVEKWFVRKYGDAAAVKKNPVLFHTYWGKKDWEFLDGFWGLEIPIVGDHKTCGSFDWAKSERDLQTSVQSGIYAWDAMEARGADVAQLRWNYMRTKGAKKCIPVVTNITRAQAEDVMGLVDETAQTLVVLKRELTKGEAIEAPGNFSACAAFGGCPHIERCNPSPMDALNAIMTQKTKTSENPLLKKLRDRKNKGKTPDAAKEAAVEVKKEEDKKDTDDKMNSKDRSGQPPPPPEARQVGESWFQPTWDNTDWEWKFPQEYHDAIAAETEAKAKADKEAKVAAKKGKPSAARGKSKAASASVSDDNLLDAIIERIATRVAEKLKEN